MPKIDKVKKKKLSQKARQEIKNFMLKKTPRIIRNKIIKQQKNQVIAVPTRPKTTTKTKSRPVRSQPAKTNTLAYYNCLIEQISNPTNDKVKITQLAHHCKCNKGQVAVAQQEHKQQLVQQLAKNYKAFGESLGHYLQADIVGCVKELKK